MSTAIRDFRAAQGVQRRSTAAELRVAGDEFALVGYAATFNSLSKNLGGFREKIAPGAFSRSVNQGADVKALFNHAPDNILGRTKSGTLQLTQDDKGLHFRCDLNKESQAHRDLYAAVKRGDIDECSFAFTVPKGGDSWMDATDPETGAACAMRTLSDVDLVDVSVVTYPAYNDTSASARSHQPDYGRKPLLDPFAVDMMRKAARAMCAPQRRGNPGLNQEAYDLIGGHLQRCHEALEDAYATADTLNQLMDTDYPDDLDNGWDDDDDMRAQRAAQCSFKRSFQRAAAQIDATANRLAAMRLHHSKLADALGRRK